MPSMSVDMAAAERNQSRPTIFDYLAGLTEGNALPVEDDERKAFGDHERDQSSPSIFDYLAGLAEPHPEEDENVTHDHAYVGDDPELRS
jgi:hypothetical protein